MVVIVLGILAAIAIPRLIENRQRAFDTTAVSDLRNLVVIETGLEAGPGLSEDPAVIAGQGWRGSDPQVRVCAEILNGGEDITVTAWHLGGSLVYSYTRSVGVLQSNSVTIEETCAAQVGIGSTQVWPYP